MLIAGYHERRARLGSFSAHREPRASRRRMDNHPDNRVPRAVRTTPSRWHTDHVGRTFRRFFRLRLPTLHLVASSPRRIACCSPMTIQGHALQSTSVPAGSAWCVCPAMRDTRRARLWPKPLSGGRAARTPMTVAMAPAAAATGGRTAARMSRNRMPPVDQSRSSVFMPLGPQLYLASVTAQGAAVLTQYFVLAC
jgi:hypothetical protein